MADKFAFSIQGNDFLITDDVDDRIEKLRFTRHKIRFDKTLDEYFFKKLSDNTIVGNPNSYLFADIIDATTGLAFPSLLDLNIFLSSNLGLVEPLDYHVELAKGNILGDEPFDLDIVSTQIGNSSFTDIWGESTNLIYEASATVWEVLSSDAADAVAGTGASKVRITTLDANFDLQTQDVTLTGVTPVALTGTHIRPHEMKVIAPVGTDLSNKGKLTLRGFVSGNTQDSIIALKSKSFSTHFTVPAGKEALLVRGSVLVGKGDDIVVQKASVLERANEPVIIEGFARVYQSGQQFVRITPIPIPEKTSIRFQGKSTNSGITVTAAAEFIITDL